MRVANMLALLSLALGGCARGIDGDFSDLGSKRALPIKLASLPSNPPPYIEGAPLAATPIPLAVDATNVYWAYWSTAVKCAVGGCDSGPTREP